MTQHTPLPWIARTENDFCDIATADEQGIEIVHAVLRKSDAEYIVTACNAYPKLVEALEKWQKWAEIYAPEFDLIPTPYATGQAALANIDDNNQM